MYELRDCMKNIVLLFLLLSLPSVLAVQESVAVVNAASFLRGFPVAPGSWATAFADFASVGVIDTFADSVPFPTMLGGVQVFVNEVAAPMNFVGRGQINFQVPGATPLGQVALRVTVSGMTTYEGTINIIEASPGLLSLNPADPDKPGAIRNQDGTINSEANPARRGEVIVIFGVGQGPVTEIVPDGSPAPDNRLIRTTSDPEVFISVAQATINFSGLAPTLVGVWQLNVVVSDLPFISGLVPVFAKIGGIASEPVSFWVDE